MERGLAKILSRNLARTIVVGVVSEIVPFESDTILLLDGSIHEDSGNYYLTDKSGNNRHFLITDYDWSDRSVKGFPYKSAATISAPPSDSVLQAEDINNFFYDSGGTPNQIPVVSLFQDIDYEHKLFCKHAGQVLDGITGVELSEPCVKQIVLYNSLKIGSDLDKCNVYFNVPGIVNGAAWVAENGNDITGDGSHSKPYATLDQAKTTAVDTIYVKTGNIDMGATYHSQNKAIIGTGFVNLTNLPGGFCILAGRDIKGLIVDRADSAYPFYFDTNLDISMERCLIRNYNQMVQTGVRSGELIVKNCIGLLGDSTKDIFYTKKQYLTIDTCFISGDQNRLIRPTSNLDFGIELKHSYINTPTTIVMTCYASHEYARFFDNNFVQQNSLTIADESVAEFKFNYNNGKINHIESTNVGTGNFEIIGNIISNDFSSAIVNLQGKNVTVSRNVFNVSGLGGFISIDSGRLINLFIDNNKFISDGDSTSMSIGSNYDSRNTIRGYYRNNFMLQKKANPANGHGIQVLEQDYFHIYNNWCEGVGLAYVYKGRNFSFANSMLKNNIAINGRLLIKGGSYLKVYNNTVVNRLTEPCLYILDNPDGDTGCNYNDIKNNIFIELKSTSVNYGVVRIEDDPRPNYLDYNIYYSINAPIGQIINSGKTWAEWQALGYEVNGKELTAQDFSDLFTDFDNDDFTLKIGSEAIGSGVDLGDAYKAGLCPSTDFGNDNELPYIEAKDQGEIWDCGAYVT